MHLADAFIQRDLHYIQGTHLSSMNQTHDFAVASALLNCLNNRKALPLLFQIILAHQKDGLYTCANSLCIISMV